MKPEVAAGIGLGVGVIIGAALAIALAYGAAPRLAALAAREASTEVLRTFGISGGIANDVSDALARETERITREKLPI